MAVALQEISSWLDNADVSHEVLNDDNKIVFGISNGETNKGIAIELEENGKVFQLYVNLLDEHGKIVKIKDHQHEAKVWSHILSLNYKTKFGTWEYDPTDGEIRCAIEIPLEDATMTEKQFKRIFGYVTKDAQDGFDAILKILETGEVPDDLDDFKELLLKALLQTVKEIKSSDDGI